MWPIIYRICIPGILLVILFGTYAFLEFRALKKQKRNRKSLLITYIIVALLGFSVSVYWSCDLILQDHMTQQGIYTHYYRGKEVYIQELHFLVNGKDKLCHTFSPRDNELEVGKEYRFTYSKRSLMLLCIEEVDLETETQGETQ